MFSALRLGSSIYILYKNDKPELKTGLVISTPNNAYSSYLPNTTVDLSVKVDGELLEFKQLPALASIANYNSGNTIISENRDLMCLEVENMLRTSKLILDSIPYHEQIIVSGEEILKQLSPLFALLKDLEDKINNLEHKVGGIETKLDSITEMLTKALKQ